MSHISTFFYLLYVTVLSVFSVLIIFKNDFTYFSTFFCMTSHISAFISVWCHIFQHFFLFDFRILSIFQCFLHSDDATLFSIFVLFDVTVLNTLSSDLYVLMMPCNSAFFSLWYQNSAFFIFYVTVLSNYFQCSLFCNDVTHFSAFYSVWYHSF